MKRLIHIALLTAVSALTGCLPVPHFDHDYPVVSGRLLLQGTPVSQGKVLIQHNGPERSCPKPDQAVSLAQDGTFAFQPEGSFRLFMKFGDRKDSWTVCFHMEDGKEFSWNSDGYWGGPRKQKLRCEIVEAGKDAEGALNCSADS